MGHHHQKKMPSLTLNIKKDFFLWKRALLQMSHLLETLEKAIKQEACKKRIIWKGFRTDAKASHTPFYFATTHIKSHF